MGKYTIDNFLRENSERLSLKLLAGNKGLSNELVTPELNRPGLALSGFVNLFLYNRIQLIGNTEVLYANGLSTKKRLEAYEIICQFEIPCIVFTNGKYPPDEMIKSCNKNGIPLIISSLTTTQFTHLFSYYVEDIFAPSITVHGALVDVYGVGLLFTGRPGIGKSEVTLDLVERGHRLVADDIIHIIRKSRGIVVGTSNPMTRSLLEIRGVGIVDVEKMFGIRAIRMQKRIEVEVQLKDWDPDRPMDRTGLDEKISTILDVDISRVEVPIYPGKYVAVIVESIALDHLLKMQGFDVARDLATRQMEQIKEKQNRARK
ncbi:MAG: HPr(Ser) kinase/phosphatase [Candidatus Latescibacteria bacterium]|nr:HPr(Ser) kinase/phosphatase [Candidatus Latescibacterota bacterium]